MAHIQISFKVNSSSSFTLNASAQHKTVLGFFLSSCNQRKEMCGGNRGRARCHIKCAVLTRNEGNRQRQFTVETRPS